jgi:hypothetical protein
MASSADVHRHWHCARICAAPPPPPCVAVRAGAQMETRAGVPRQPMLLAAVAMLLLLLAPAPTSAGQGACSCGTWYVRYRLHKFALAKPPERWTWLDEADEGRADPQGPRDPPCQPAPTCAMRPQPVPCYASQTQCATPCAPYSMLCMQAPPCVLRMLRCPQFSSQGRQKSPPCLPCRCCACRIPSQAVATAKLLNDSGMIVILGFHFWPEILEPMPGHMISVHVWPGRKSHSPA